MHPEIHAIMRKYGPQRQPLPGQEALGLVPTSVNGIPCDVQPWPVRVPKPSIAAAYDPSNRLFP
jgi:hypothetical protein